MSTAEQLDTLVAAGRWRDARALAAQHADEGEPAAVQQLLGRLAWLDGDGEAALGHLNAAAELGELPADLATLRLRLMRTAAPAEADAGLEARADEGDARALLAWGDRLAATGRWAEAAACFERAAEQAETAGRVASAALGRLACAEALDDAAAGEGAMAALVSAWPDLIPEDAHHALATLARLAPERAPGLVDRLSLGGLPPADQRLLAARLAWLAGDHGGALAAAEAAVELDPEDDDARRLLAELLLVDDRVEAARPLVRALAARGAASPDLVLALFEASGRVGRDRAALAELLDLAGAHPHHAGVGIAAARALTDAGREGEGRAMLNRALKSDARLATRMGPLDAFFAASRDALPSLFQRLDIDPRATLVRVRLGHNALLYQVHTADGDRFVKAFFPGARTRAHVEATARLETRLAALGGPVAVPRSLEADGALTHPLAGGWAMVTEGIDGRSLRRTLHDARRQMSAAHGVEVGRALGQLHAMLDGIDGAPARPIPTSDGIDPIESATGESTEAWHRPRSAEGVRSGFDTAADWAAGRRDWRELVTDLTEGCVDARLVDALAARLEPLFARWRRVLPALPTGVIHGDYGWHNLLWSQGRVVGVVDFDYAARDIRAADLANALHRTAFDFNRLTRGLSPRPRAEVARGIIDGYRSVRPLPVPDFDALDAVARGVRCVYTLSLARADRTSVTGAQYGRPARLIEALIRQLDWLDRHGGLGAMLRGG